MTRIYEIRKRGTGEILKWGASRFGNGCDDEVGEIILSGTLPGDDKIFCVCFTPTTPRMKTAEQVRAQRIRNMHRRAAKLPLFADQIKAKEMKKDYFSINHAKRSQTRRKINHEHFVNEFWEDRSQNIQVALNRR